MSDHESNSEGSGGQEFERIKENLNYELSNVSGYNGTFASHSTHLCAPNPGLQVADLLLPLPVRDDDAKRIFDLADPSPHGRGEQTVIDENVRRSRQVDAEKVRVRNRGFKKWLLEEIVRKNICKDLGIMSTENVRIHLYKLLIYEPGGLFTPHRDTPKEESMFGTLAVVLPSKFEGGAVVVEHKGQKTTFDLGKESDFSTGIAAWYADVLHNVTPVLSGYRLVLTYNLTMSGTEVPLASTIPAFSALFTQSLRALHSEFRGVAGLLDHQYSQLTPQTLKGCDKYVVENLAKIVKEYSFDLYLADLEIVYCGNGEDGWDAEEDTTTYSLEGWHFVNGVGTARRQNRWDKEDFLGENPVECLTPYESREEPTGNAGIEIDKRYRHCCLVLLPAAKKKRQRAAEEVEDGNRQRQKTEPKVIDLT